VSPFDSGPSAADLADAELHENRPELYQEYFSAYGFRFSKAVNFDIRLNDLAKVCARQHLAIKQLEQRVQGLEDWKGEPWQAKPGGLRKERGQSHGRKSGKAHTSSS
jgi:hypothetical protein